MGTSGRSGRWGNCQARHWGLVLFPNPTTAFPADCQASADRRPVASANGSCVSPSLHLAAPRFPLRLPAEVAAPTGSPGLTGWWSLSTHHVWLLRGARATASNRRRGVIVGDVTPLGWQGGPLGRVSSQGSSGLQSPQLHPSPSPSLHCLWGRCYSYPQFVAEEIGEERGCRAGRGARRPECRAGVG